ncbi:retropepsin-like aspartic protease family protein [Iningainema tapete]|uniref:Retroviral-like aspartic protease family protein n=1 Tax=Iningainema tapete BLCC-T55 TaxID=2748662 RepID=A0A8J7C8W6_9CYAN|nr:retropepsin-like aspartic protease [Iningainema tapete]MBD2777299.1 retroviral-like aspartic protease family protein [Iningainema tapete BLCC-T55]
MLNSYLSRVPLIVLSTTVAIFTVACNQEKQITATVTHQQSTPVATTSNSASPTPEATPQLDIDPSSYENGLDKAAGAVSISKSAYSTEDWQLVVSQYQNAIAFMKQVKADNIYFANAQKKIKEYQRQIKYAKRQATRLVKVTPPQELEPVVVAVPQPSPTIAPSVQPKVDCNDITQRTNNRQCPSLLAKRKQSVPIPVPPPEFLTQQPQVFTVPIKRRVGGTPIIEVTFNGIERFEMIVDTGASGTVITQEMASILAVTPVGKAKANTASSKAVEFQIGYVNSVEVGGLTVNQLAVAIAGAELDTGLLGHDFFGKYDITIKRDVVEFRPQS